MSRHLVNLCHSFYGILTDNIVIFYTVHHILGVRLRTWIVFERVDFKGGLLDCYQHCLDRERGGQQSGQLLRDGQDGERGDRAGLILRLESVLSSDPVPINQSMCMFMFLYHLSYS